MSNPLNEATPDSIDELMSRDPLGYSKVDLEKIVGIFREQRKNWLIAEAQGKKTKAVKAAKTPKEIITLDDLEI